VKVVSWNIAWMNNWFVGGNAVALRERYVPANAADADEAIANVDALCRRVAQVITSLAPDILCIQEGPSDRREMELFVSTYLADGAGQSRYSVFGGYDGSAQKIYILVNRWGPGLNPRVPDDPLTQALSEDWQCDVEGDFTLQPYHFTRRPVVIDCDYEDMVLRVVGLHTKSKFISNGEALWNNLARRPEFIRDALKARRRISIESVRIRRYLDDLLTQNPHHAIVVLGDCNDGPGADYFEDRYLTHNLTDILLGSTFQPALQFEHAFLYRLPQAQRFTALFRDFVEDNEEKALVLDHILVSPVLRSGGGISAGLLNGGIGHQAFMDATDDTAASGREKAPSDHRPVFALFGP
jgi:endonuclease/exonuclease/phosphatase family metal-dependent hydrolase